MPVLFSFNQFWGLFLVQSLHYCKTPSAYERTTFKMCLNTIYKLTILTTKLRILDDTNLLNEIPEAVLLIH